MINIIVGVIIILILALSIGYIVRAKRSGVHCIGCPSAGTGCSGNCGGCSSHENHNKDTCTM